MVVVEPIPCSTVRSSGFASILSNALAWLGWVLVHAAAILIMLATPCVVFVGLLAFQAPTLVLAIFAAVLLIAIVLVVTISYSNHARTQKQRAMPQINTVNATSSNFSHSLSTYAMRSNYEV